MSISTAHFMFPSPPIQDSICKKYRPPKKWISKLAKKQSHTLSMRNHNISNLTAVNNYKQQVPKKEYSNNTGQRTGFHMSCNAESEFMMMPQPPPSNTTGGKALNLASCLGRSLAARPGPRLFFPPLWHRPDVKTSGHDVNVNLQPTDLKSKYFISWWLNHPSEKY